MYYQLEDALQELEKRRRDTELIRRIDEFLGECPIPSGDFGFIPRNIATSRYEDYLFKMRCETNGLSPMWLEYAKDLFSSNNPSKIRMVRLFFHEGNGRNGGPKLKKVYIAGKNIDVWEQKPLSKIITDNGASLVEYHHSLRHERGIDNGRIQWMDVSEWLSGLGMAQDYYEHFLAAFCSRGILFESFESPGFPKLEYFKNKIVIPAWKKVCENFCKPLIVMHPGNEFDMDEEKILNWYPTISYQDFLEA